MIAGAVNDCDGTSTVALALRKALASAGSVGTLVSTPLATMAPTTRNRRLALRKPARRGSEEVRACGNDERE
jgi:hypothetical protein